jgi:hypothetical protein
VDDDLDAGEGRHRMKQQEEASVTAAASPHAGWFGAWRAGVQPYLGARTRSGDMMGDRVPARGGCGRSFYGGRPRVRNDAPRGDRSIRELATPHQRSRRPGAHDASQFRRRLAVRRGPALGRPVLGGCGRPRGPAAITLLERPAAAGRWSGGADLAPARAPRSSGECFPFGEECTWPNTTLLGRRRSRLCRAGCGLVTSEEGWELGQGDHMQIPSTRHRLESLETLPFS